MDENESTKSGPEQNQPDAGPDVMQQESPRTCKICGGPNHHGCGCEAKAYRKADLKHKAEYRERMAATETGDKTSQPEPKPAESKTDDTLEDILSPDAIREAHEAQMKSYKDIERMAVGFEELCVCMFDHNNYLKLIAGDLITIRKHLTKEDEVKDADKNKN